MTRIVLFLAILLAASGITLPAQARDPEGVQQLTEAPTALDPNKAYLLFESSRAKSGIMKITHVFLRVPTEAELSAYRAAKEAAYQKALPKLTRRAKGKPVPTIDEYEFSWDGAENIFAVNMGDELGESDWFLIEVPPGEYVLYGTAISSRALAVCNCLGTVKFEAQAGAITHLGGLFADKSHKDSPVPHIEDNLGEHMFNYGWVLSQAVVPADTNSSVPTGLTSLPWEPADYQPVPAFVDPSADSINRLAPIPGVLEYERGRVVVPDPNGQEAE